MVLQLGAKSPQHVSYGDITCILCSELKGIVTSDPDISNALFLDEQDSFRDRLVPHSLRGSIFSVTPKFEYSADKAYKKRLQKVKDLGKKITEHNWRRKLDRSDPLYKDLAADQGKVAEEKETNKVEARRKEGTSLVYGATIQLQLTGTNKFVSQAKNRARLDKLAMQIELAEGGGDGSWWVVTDKEDIRQDGDFVRYCDKVCLKNAKFQQSYFYVSADSVVRTKVSDAGEIAMSSVFHASIQTRYEVNASATKCQFEFFPYGSWTDSRVRLDRVEDTQGEDRETSIIRGGDTVTLSRKSAEGIRYLYHKFGSETATWGLESEVIYPWDFGNVTFDEVQNTDTSELKSMRLLPGTFWRVKARQMEMGGEQLSGHTTTLLVLQNIGTGKYLATRNGGEVWMSEELHKAECAWKFASRGGHESVVSSGQPVWCLFDGLTSGSREDNHRDSQRWLSLSYEDADDDVKPGQVEAEIGVPVRVGAKRRAVVGVECGEAPTDRDVMEIKMVEIRESDKVDYMRRCRDTLSCIKFRLGCQVPLDPELTGDAAKAAFRRHPVRDVLAGERKTLTVMLSTISNSCTISSDEDPMTRTGPPNVEQQNLIREMGFMEIVVDLMVFFGDQLRLPMNQFKAHFQTEYFLCRLSYLLVEKACTANRLSKSRMQKYVPFMMNQISFEIGSYFAWMAIYSGNREMLVKVSEGEIFSITQKMASRNDRVVNFLLEATHFQVEAIKPNQEMISRLLLQQRMDLLFTMEVAEDDLLFHENSDSGKDLKTISIRAIIAEEDYDMETIDEWLTSVELPSSLKLQRLRYYLQLLKLMAGVAMGADPEVKEIVLQVMKECNLEPEHLSRVVSSDWLPSTIRSYCLGLWFRVLVVGDPSSKQTMSTGTRVWYPTRIKVEKEEQREAQQARTMDANALAREMQEGWRCEPEVADHLRKTLLEILRREHATDVDLMGKNIFAKVVLDALYELVSFGHLHKEDIEFEYPVPDFERMREVADALVPLLDGREDVCGPFAGWDKDVARFHVNERTQVVMQLKLRVMDVLVLFFQCAHEERWTRFIRCWTKLVNRHFGVTSWEDVMGAIQTTKHNGGPAPFETPPAARHSMPSLRSTFSRSAKLVPQLQLTDYISGKKSWDKNDAPWTREEIHEVSTTLFGDPPIISDFFATKKLSEMFKRGQHFFMPPWISLLLDLVQYDSHKLKEKALTFLIATFNSQAKFLQNLKSTQLITFPDMAKIFFSVRREMGILRNHIPLLSSADKMQRERGFLVVEHIMKHWQTILTHKRPRGVTTGLQSIINDLGAAEIAVRILFVPFKRVRAEGIGKFDTAELLSGEPGHRLVHLFTRLYRMLAALCDGNIPIQNKLIKYCEWKESHLGIEGLDVELLLESCTRDNEPIVTRVGQSWINTFFGILEQYKCRQAKLLSVLEPLIKCNGNMVKENQSLVSVRFKECVDVVGYFMTTDEDWDLRIQLMKQEQPEDRRDLLSFHLHVLSLLVATSEGRSAAAEVYAAKYISFKNACKTLVFLNFDSNRCQAVDVLPTQLYRVRTEYMRFLLNVYTDTRVESLLDELNEVGNGLWLFDDDPDCDCTMYEPLMVVCEMDIRKFTELVGRNEEKDRPCILAIQQYLFSAVFPFLELYFAVHYSKVKGRTYGDDEVRAHKLFEAVETLVDQGLPPELELVYIAHGSASVEIDCVKSGVDLLKAMSQKGRVREDWAQRDRLRPREVQRVETEADRQFECWLVLRKSYESLYEAISKHVGISDTTRMISKGVLQLAMLVSRRGEVPIYCSIDWLDLGRPTPKNPSWDDFVFSILAISRAGDRISASLLVDILRMLRAAIYTYEPSDPDRTIEECELDWERFLWYEPVEKASGELLAWVQNRFDALGCTTAALRLMGNRDIAVQFNSVLLLLSLLHGGNPRVQRTILNQLRVGRDVGLFTMAKNVIDRGCAKMAEFRKIMKRHKAAFAAGIDVASMCRGDARLQSGMQLDSFGRGSLLMAVLRMIQVHLHCRDHVRVLVVVTTALTCMVQLLCKRHFRPLQSMLLSQVTALVSHNLVRSCITLLLAAAPLLEDSLEYNVGEVAILCMQTLDTLTEAAQGPNLAVGKEVINSGVLALLCTILQCTGFVSLPLDKKKADGLDCSVNDIRIWLRHAITRCILAVLEGMQDEKACDEVRKYVDLRVLCSQLVQSGRLIGHVRPSDMSDDDVAALIAEDNDNDFVNNSSARLSGTGSMLGSRSGSLVGSIMGGSISGGSMLGFGGSSSERRLPPPTEMGFAKGWEKSLESEVFSIYFILLHLQEYDQSGEVGSKVASTLKAHKRLQKFLTTLTSHVELSRRLAPNNPPIVVKVFFRMNKHVKYLTEGKDFRIRTEESLFDVPRNNPQEKADAFFHKMRFAVDRVTWLMEVSKSPLKRFFIQFRDVFDKTPILISVIITILLLFTYGIPMDPNTGRPLAEGKFYTRGPPPAGYEARDYPFASMTSDPTGIGASYGSVVHQSDLALQYRVKLTNRWNSEKEWDFFPEGRVIIYLLSALHVFVSTCNAVVYLIQDLPLLIFQTLDHYFLQTLGRVPWMPRADEEEDEDEPTTLMVGVQRRKKRLTGRAYLKTMPEPQELQQDHALSIGMDLQWRLVRANKTTFYVALNLIVSILGLTSSPFFFVLQLLDYFRMRDGRLVLRSIIVGGPNLFRSFVLGIIVIVCFGFMTYTYFSPTVNNDQEQCHSPWQCVTKHILDSMTGDLTTVLGTDLGVWAFSAIVPWEDLWKTWRTLFVFVSLIFWVFLLQGIIQGQIIDAFAEMRTESNQAKEDLEQKCFISSLERYAFADFPGEWEKRRGGKFAWNYLHYSSYLNSADPDEFDGNERAMYAAYCRMSSEFLPVGEFFAARRAHTEDEMAKELDDVRGRLGGLEVAVGRLADSFQREMRKMRERMPNNSAGNGLGHHMSRPSRTGSDISLEEVQESPSSTLDGARTLLPPQPPVSNGSSGGAVQ